MRRVSHFLPDDQLKKLQSLSKQTGVPVAELVRRAIADYLVKEKQKKGPR